jgi:AraC-like DNA-binding protein
MIKIFYDIFRRSFTKYLVSYIFCLLLPLIVFSMVYRTVFLATYADKLIETTEKSLEDTFANIDLQLNNLRHISEQILISPQFSDRYFSQNSWTTACFTLIDILKTYSAPNEYVHEILVFDRYNGYIYSSTGSTAMKNYITWGIAYSESAREKKLGEILLATRGQVWLPVGEVYLQNNTTRRLLTYLSSSPLSVTHSNTAVAILVYPELFDRTLRPSIPYNGSTAVVFDHSGTIIYSLAPELNVTIQKALEMDTLREGAAVVKIDNRDYFVSRWESETNGLSYLSLISYREITAPVRAYMLIFIQSLLGIMLGGSLLIFVLMRRNYKPIQKIARFSRERGFPGRETGGDYQYLNDIDLIQMALENISKENVSLAICNEKYLREATFFSLLRGGPGGVSLSAAQLAKAGIETDGVQYSAVIFQLTDNKTIPFDRFEELLGTAGAKLLMRHRVYLVEYLEKNSFIGIVIHRGPATYFNTSLEQLCVDMGKETRAKIKAACGNPVQSIQDISISYSQARAALRCQIQKETRTVLGFQDMNIEEVPDYLYLRAELTTLEEAIKAKNATRVGFIVSELTRIIKNENTSYFYAVCLCYNIINIFIQEIYKIKNIEAAEIIKEHQTLFLENYDHLVENLITIVTSLARETMRIIGVTEQKASVANKENILAYIEENYRDPDFRIQSILDHFGCSFSNLSHQFKTATGENISSYISALKMSYAKELLSTTSLTINEIAVQLGYFQTSSFIRKFRTTTGLTPGEYRAVQKSSGASMMPSSPEPDNQQQ